MDFGGGPITTTLLNQLLIPNYTQDLSLYPLVSVVSTHTHQGDISFPQTEAIIENHN